MKATLYFQTDLATTEWESVLCAIDTITVAMKSTIALNAVRLSSGMRIWREWEMTDRRWPVGGVDRNGKVDKISLQNAVETPFWMAVWATEPERMIDVRMSYSDLKIICDLIDEVRNRRAGERNE